MSLFIRRALAILLSFLLMYGIGIATYNAYMNGERKMEIGQLLSRNKTLTSDGDFTAEYRCEFHGKNLSSYTYEVEDNKLYITLYARSSEKDILEKDKDGYSKISISTGQNIETVYYRYNTAKTELTYKQKLKSNGFTYSDATLDANGTFTGRFRCVLPDKHMSSFTYKVEGENMYLTLYASKKNAMEKDDEGYSLVKVESKKKISKVYFRYDSEKILLADKQTLDNGQIDSKNLTLANNTEFSGLFKCNVAGKKITEYTHEVEGGKLYITMFAKDTQNAVLSEDKDGYAKINISAGKKITAVYYRFGESQYKLDFTKK